MDMYLGWLSFVMLYLVEDIDIMNHGEPDTQDSFYDEENDQYLLCQAQSGEF
jgi:hypothetical protein